LVSFKKIVGLKVITSKAYTLGEVKGFEVDIDNWTITHLQVKLTTEAAIQLCFKKRLRRSTVCMPIGLIKAVGEFVTIDRSIDELRKTFEIATCKD
jgi:sporulation protein YlmC with PRC-barrel domain